MKQYIKPEMVIEEFDVEDIITSSTNNIGETPDNDVVIKGEDNSFW